MQGLSFFLLLLLAASIGGGVVALAVVARHRRKVKRTFSKKRRKAVLFCFQGVIILHVLMLVRRPSTIQTLFPGADDQSEVKIKNRQFNRPFGSQEAESSTPTSSQQPHDPWKEGMTQMEMRRVRAENMFSRLTLFYQDGHSNSSDEGRDKDDRALCLLRGEGQYIFDEAGKR